MKKCTGKKANAPMTWIANAVENDPWYKARRDEVTRTMMAMIDHDQKAPAMDEVISGLEKSMDYVALVKLLQDLLIWKQDARADHHTKRIQSVVDITEKSFEILDSWQSGASECDADALQQFQELTNLMMKHRPEETAWAQRSIQAGKFLTTYGTTKVKKDVVSKAVVCAEKPTCVEARASLAQVCGLIQGVDLAQEAMTLQPVAVKVMQAFKGEVPEGQKEACREVLELFQQLCVAAQLDKEANTLKFLQKQQAARIALEDVQSLAAAPEEIRITPMGKPKIEVLRTCHAELATLAAGNEELGVETVPDMLDAQVEKDVAAYLEIFVNLDLDEADS